MSLLRRIFGAAKSAPVQPAPKPVVTPAPTPAPAPAPVVQPVVQELAPEIVVTLRPTQEVVGGITVRSHMEIICHEAIVLQAYKDSVGVWTWGVGVTDKSGHKVHPRYLGNPQTITRCLEVYEWLIRTKYLPEVRAAFGRVQLNEHQLAAALSFHWNTGAIHRASWVDSFKRGNVGQAKHEIMNWRKPAEIIKRREAERDLFFDGRWTSRGTTARIIPRVFSNGNPNWGSSYQKDIGLELTDVLLRAGK